MGFFSAEVPWTFQKASLRTLLDMKSLFNFQSKQAWSKLNIKCQYANIIGTLTLTELIDVMPVHGIAFVMYNKIEWSSAKTMMNIEHQI